MRETLRICALDNLLYAAQCRGFTAFRGYLTATPQISTCATLSPKRHDDNASLSSSMFDVRLIGFLKGKLKLGKLRALFHKVVIKTGLKSRIFDRDHKTLEEPHNSPLTDLTAKTWTAKRIAAFSNSRWPKLSHCTAFRRNKIFVFGATTPQWVRASSFTRFLDHTRRTTVGRTSLDAWSVRRRDLYLTTHNTHNRQTSMPPVRFEPTISAGERPQAEPLNRAATETGETRT